VLDFAVAQHSVEELRAKHCRVVEAFREARPLDYHGRRKFTIAMRDDAVCTYVCAEVPYHVTKGWQDDVAMAWLGDVPQDAIVLAAGNVMGLEKLSAAAAKADTAGESWLAGRYWAVASVIAWKTMDQEASRKPLLSCLDSITRSLGRSLSPAVLDDVHEVQLDRMAAFAMLLDVAALIARAGEIEELRQSRAAERDPLAFSVLLFLSNGLPYLFSGQGLEVGICFADGLWSTLMDGMQCNPDPSVR
jgi:hypothetical protein